MAVMKVEVGSELYKIGSIPAEDQFKMLHFIQGHDKSGLFVTLSIQGLKKTEENDDPEKAFDDMARLVLASIASNSSYQEYSSFCSTMLKKSFKDAGDSFDVGDFQGRLKDYEVLVSHSMRQQFGDFFQLKDQS